MNRFHRVCALLLAACSGLTLPVTAQFSQPLFALGLEAVVSPSTGGLPATYAGNVVLDVPLRSWLPQTSPDSRIRLAAIGLRQADQDNSEPLRVQLSVLDMHLQRSRWSGSVNLLDLDESWLLARRDVWLEGGTGPGFHIDRGTWGLSGRLQAFGGRSRLDTAAPGMDGQRETGWHGGVRSSVAFRWMEWLRVVTESARTSHSGSPLSCWSMETRVEAHPATFLQLGLVHQEVEPTQASDPFRGSRSRVSLSALIHLH